MAPPDAASAPASTLPPPADGDDDTPRLGAATQAALLEFLREQQEAADADDGGEGGAHAPDWGLSQFWYTDATADTVAAAAAARAGPSGRVACVACPSLFRALLRRPDAAAEGGGGVRHHLFEYDDRFQSLGPFSHYDYRAPSALPPELLGAFAVVVADPPYLSEECLERTAVTVRALASPGSALVLLSGAVTRGLAHRLLGLRPTVFRPQHACKLGNEFIASTDDEEIAGALGGWDGELGVED